MQITNTTFYKDTISPQIDRLLSLEDRNCYSPTFGCFDRDYWAWKFKDIQDACMQNGVYALALLWNTNFEGNIYFKNDNVLKWVIAGLKRWCKIQHRNGSFDQIFPNEYSYGATAFTLFYMLETYNIIDNMLSTELKDKFIISARKAAKFIIESEEEHGIIANHRCAAAAALSNYHLISGDNKFKFKAKDILTSIFQNQDEGWLPEYGGADPGYQTLALYYLAKYYVKSKDEEIFAKIKELVKFLSYFIHPDGSIGGEYGSRNTEIFYPAGVALLKNQIPLAKRIIDAFYKNLLSKGQISLNTMDDSNFIPLVINYLEVFILENKLLSLQSSRAVLPPLPFEQGPFNKYFKKAKLYVANAKHYYALLGIGKNGLLKVYDKDKKQIIYDDCGYIVETDGGVIFSSQYFNPDVQVNIDKNSIVTKGFFTKMSLPVPTPGKIFILRFLNLTICRSKTIGNLIKRFLVRMLIKRRGQSLFSLERTVQFSEDNISIIDRLSKPPSLKIVKLTRGEKHSTMHMATSEYFKKSELRGLKPFSDFDIERFNRESILEISFNI